MKHKSFIIMIVIMLLIGNILVNASSTKIKLCNNCDRVEEYTCFGKNTEDAPHDNDPSGEEHGMRHFDNDNPEYYYGISQNVHLEDSIAEYCINIGEISNLSSDYAFQIGIKYLSDPWDIFNITWANRPNLYIWNYSISNKHPKGKWDLINDTLPDQYSIKWRWYSIDSDIAEYYYLCGPGNYYQYTNKEYDKRGDIRIKIVSELYNYLVIEEVGVRFADNYEIDQCQVSNSGSAKLRKDDTYAQSFTPDFNFIDRIKIPMSHLRRSDSAFEMFLCYTIEPWKPILKLDITPDFGVQDIGMGWECNGPDRWVDARLKGAQLRVIPGHQYYIVVNHYVDYDSEYYSWLYSDDNPYSDGSSYLKDSYPNNINYKWEEQTDRDFCFRTFGTDEELTEYDIPKMDIEIPQDDDGDNDYEVEFMTVVENPDVVPYRIIKIINRYPSGSPLQWEITKKPDWIRLYDLADPDEEILEGVTYRPPVDNTYNNYDSIAAELKMNKLEGKYIGRDYWGEIKIENKEDRSNRFTIFCTVTVIKSKTKDTIPTFFENLIQQFPIFFNIINNLITIRQ